jgi:bifunctional ADP-heptose synthase (sugar kinase/adenylyltransferase)
MPASGPGLAAATAVKQRLLAEGIDVRTLPTDSPLPEKQRFLVGAQKVMKLDLVDRVVVDASMGDRLIDLAASTMRENKGATALIADFGLGLFSLALLRRLCAAVRPHASIMAGDVSGRRSNLTAMTGMDLICPSESEARDAIGLHDQGLPAVTWKLLERTNTRRAIITMGPDGLIAFDRLDAERMPPKALGAAPAALAAGPSPGGDGWARRVSAEHVPALTPFAIAPLGCGDALLASAALTLASGGSLLSAAFLGATAASIQAQRLGNLPVSATDLRHAVARLHAAHLTYTPADVLASRAPRASARSIVAAAV